MIQVSLDKDGLLESFKSIYNRIEGQIIEELESWQIPKEIVKWIFEMVSYTVPGGKLNRGLTVVETMMYLQASKPDASIGIHDLELAAYLGWCIEVLQASFLVADDVMDESILRRGQPCWYKKVGMVAINDAFILQSLVYRILKRHFSQSKSYPKLMELFLEMTYKTEIGQLLDLITAPTGQTRFDLFTKERYEFIIRWKTAYYSFYLPVVAGMIQTEDQIGIDNSPAIMSSMEDILLSLGEFFQIQDDYLDCFGDAQLMGKMGSDIYEGKCTWLIVNALELAQSNSEIIARLQANYGRHSDPNCQLVVKNIYVELGLDGLFEKLQREKHVEITRKLDCMSKSAPEISKAIGKLAQRIFYRQK